MSRARYTAPMTVLVQPELREALHRIAKERRMSMGEIVRDVLSRYVRRHDPAVIKPQKESVLSPTRV
jgi:predicted transcriptional regulator